MSDTYFINQSDNILLYLLSSRNNSSILDKAVLKRSYMTNIMNNVLCDTTCTMWDKIHACMNEFNPYTLVLRFTDQCCVSCVSSTIERFITYTDEINIFFRKIMEYLSGVAQYFSNK